MNQPPLCVDFDGSLIKTDSLHEALVVALKTRPWVLAAACFRLLIGGKSGFKTYLAERINLDVSIFPRHDDVIDFIYNERSSGLGTGGERSPHGFSHAPALPFLFLKKVDSLKWALSRPTAS